MIRANAATSASRSPTDLGARLACNSAVVTESRRGPRDRVRPPQLAGFPLQAFVRLQQLHVVFRVRFAGFESPSGSVQGLLLRLEHGRPERQLPHEARPGDRALMRSLFERVDAVLVHSDSQARLAHEPPRERRRPFPPL